MKLSFLPLLALLLSSQLLAQEGTAKRVAEWRKQALGKELREAATAMGLLREAGAPGAAALLEVAQKRKDGGRGLAFRQIARGTPEIGLLPKLLDRYELDPYESLTAAQAASAWNTIHQTTLIFDDASKSTWEYYQRVERIAWLAAIARTSASDPAAGAKILAGVLAKRPLPPRGYPDLAVVWNPLFGDGPSALEVVVTVLASADRHEQLLALTALGVGVSKPEEKAAAAEALCALELASLPPALRWRALECLDRQVDDAALLEARARPLLADPEALTRTYAARILALRCEDPDAAEPVLLASGASKDPLVRAIAVLSLGVYGSRPDAALACLSKALADKAAGVRHSAVLAIAELAPGSPRAQDLLRSALEDSDERVKAAARKALEKLGGGE